MLFINNTYYIIDETSRRIHRYSKNGRLEKIIGKNQLGYDIDFSFMDFCGSDSIYVLSNDNYSTYIFDLDLNYQRKINLKFSPVKIAKLANDRLAFYNGYGKTHTANLLITDYNGNLLDQIFDYPNNTPEVHFNFSGNLVNSDDLILYNDASTSTIYVHNQNLNLLKKN